MLKEIQLPVVLAAIPALDQLNVAPNTPTEFVQSITKLYVNSFFRPDGPAVRAFINELIVEIKQCQTRQA